MRLRERVHFLLRWQGAESAGTFSATATETAVQFYLPRTENLLWDSSEWSGDPPHFWRTTNAHPGLPAAAGSQDSDSRIYFDHPSARCPVSTSLNFPESLRGVCVITCLQTRNWRSWEANGLAPSHNHLLNMVPPTWAP